MEAGEQAWKHNTTNECEPGKGMWSAWFVNTSDILTLKVVILWIDM